MHQGSWEWKQGFPWSANQATSPLGHMPFSPLLYCHSLHHPLEQEQEVECKDPTHYLSQIIQPTAQPWLKFLGKTTVPCICWLLFFFSLKSPFFWVQAPQNYPFVSRKVHLITVYNTLSQTSTKNGRHPNSLGLCSRNDGYTGVSFKNGRTENFLPTKSEEARSNTWEVYQETEKLAVGLLGL